jgi:drug/metabolite transporter (DMT)-like permease
MAGVTSIVWGTTLVSSKVLLHYGLTPAQIMLYRFIIAYLFLWILYPRTHRIKSVKDEFSFLSIGFFGGTLYFLLENTALEYTQATNVGLICATVPLLTAMLATSVYERCPAESLYPCRIHTIPCRSCPGGV